MTLDQSHVDRAVALIKKGAANADYFFDKLESPDWIEPLAAKGLFSEPYAAVRQGEMISFPFWVPGQYLARMAALPMAQEQVLQVLKRLPQSDNPRVYEVVADAAAALPPAMAKQLIPQLQQGLELSIQLTLPGKISAVIVRLADAHFGPEALLLTKALLSIKSSPPPTPQPDDEVSHHWITREASGRIDGWQYADILETVLKSLLRSSGSAAFQALCDLLEEAVAAGRKEASTGPDDYSYIWRTSVEHSNSRRENIREELVSAVRDAADFLVESSPTDLADLVKSLGARPTRIFHRIALFVLLQHGEHDLPLVESSLSNPTDWANIGLHPEYELLLARYFDRLSPKLQRMYLEWVNQGPDQAAYVAFRREMDGEDPKESDVVLHRDVWIRDHLAVLAPHLAPADAKRLTELERIGPSRAVGRPLHQLSVEWRGANSPLTDEETLSLSWPSLILKMQEWSPPVPGNFEGPSVEGLAGSIRQRVNANPHEAVQHLAQVVGVRPPYISGILEVLREAVKRKAILQWEPLLNFILRSVDEADEARDHQDQWRWVSKCAASLINESFGAGAASIPMSFRVKVWAILERLTKNSDPTPEHEDRFGGTNMDPSTLSINTVRGEAFHAVFRYCLWVRRHLESLPAADYLKRGLDELPEARATLDRHLDPTVEPSLAVRSVYGQWFPWLLLIDSVFAQACVERIFPEATGEEPFFWAAWGAYVVFCNAYTTVLPVLRPVYARAIQATDDGIALKVAHNEHPAEHLADHLMAYYWRGELSLGTNDLVDMFFARGNTKLRLHALQWVGRSMATSEDAISGEVTTRLTALWDWRMSRAYVASEELQAFGWWFGSGKMNNDWALKTLHQVLALSVLPEPDHMVAERLAILANEYPFQAVESLDRMIDLASKGWSIHGWLESARGILESGLRSGDETTKRLAERVIHKLGTLRFRDFRALLRSVSEANS